MGQQSEQHSTHHQPNHFIRAILTGLIGGLFWSMIGMISFYFNFVEIPIRAYVLNPWTRADWTTGWIGHIVSILLVAILSMGVAIIYYGILRKRNTMWVGVWFGIVLWLIVFLLLNPLFSNIPSFDELTYDTIVTSLALYILYGVFIGYSISFDYHDDRPSIQVNE